MSHYTIFEIRNNSYHCNKIIIVGVGIGGEAKNIPPINYYMLVLINKIAHPPTFFTSNSNLRRCLEETQARIIHISSHNRTRVTFLHGSSKMNNSSLWRFYPFLNPSDMTLGQGNELEISVHVPSTDHPFKWLTSTCRPRVPLLMGRASSFELSIMQMEMWSPEPGLCILCTCPFP
jgi:hypothetical protein